MRVGNVVGPTVYVWVVAGNAHFIVRVAVVVIVFVMPVFIVGIVGVADVFINVNFVARFIVVIKLFQFRRVARLCGWMCGEVGSYKRGDEGVWRGRLYPSAAGWTSWLKFEPADGTRAYMKVRKQA